MRTHDEAKIRQEWRGCEWLGIESIRAPKHGQPHDLTRGTRQQSSTTTTQQKGSYR
jgi:hypothetical protein